MPEIEKEEMKRLLSKYQSKLAVTLTPENAEVQSIGVIRTREYLDFKKEYLPKHMGYYEQACNQTEKIIKIVPPAKAAAALQESIEICHFNTTPTGVYSLALTAPIAVALVGALLSFVITKGLFFPLFFMGLGAALIGPLKNYPHHLAQNWRMKASNQMVLSIFYIVTYMRHTSNLELAVDFAAEHLSPPLSLDFKRVIWNIETEKYGSIRESLDAYLETWKKYNMEFIESMHLIEGSLLESAEEARVGMLDKALDVILQETYEKMLHYAHNLKSPITMLNMLGVILPILGLVILPLVVSFMEGVRWYHLATLYNFILPAAVYYLGTQILSTRPTGYGSVDISKNPELAKYRNFLVKIGGQEIAVNPIYVSIIVAFVFLFISFVPIIIHIINPGWDIATMQDGSVQFLPPGTYQIEGQKFSLVDYHPSIKNSDVMLGPFGLGASLLSLGLPLAAGISVGLYHKTRTKNVLKIRNESKRLEAEFGAALFQLGNRMADGFPAEIAFGKVADGMSGTISGEFFTLVSSNISRMGMSVEQAIFDPENGAIVQYPSDLIETSMKVLVESAKKGPMVAAQSLINLSRYIKEMHNVDERLQDLMADSISSMKSQVSFLSPTISGIVIGITSMVTTILGKLGAQLTKLGQEQGSEAAAAGGAAGLTQLFGDGIPTFYFQIIVGFYVVQIVYILTVLINGIQNGSDDLQEQYLLGVNLYRSTLLYCVIAGAVMLLFNLIAGNIMGSGIGG
ncbi:hypothetical protein HY772_01125 [Candidatus Woesearchaeota archaeon]|nr:hypothetical protein [Candidatus Woesearchaeota archaeon]